MAESQQKRIRSEEAHRESDDSNPVSKRQRPHGNILSLLEDDEPNLDLSAIFATLQQEISSSAEFDFDSPPAEDREIDGGGDEDERARSVMRHLLEASDDELGIPNPESEECDSSGDYAGIRSDEDFDFSPIPFGFVDDVIWELEDAAANYYAVLQSELFM